MQHEATREKVQDEKIATHKRVQHEKSITGNNRNMDKCNTEKPDVYCFGDVIPFIKMLSRGRDRGQIFGLFKRTYFMYGHYSNIGQKEKSATRKSGTLNVYNTEKVRLEKSAIRKKCNTEKCNTK